MKQTHLILPFSLLFVLIAVAMFLRGIELQDATARIEQLPRSGRGFYSQVVPLSQFERDMLGEASGYKFIYDWKGTQYMLTILDGTHNRQAVHDPRYCFIGAGWQIERDESIRFGGGKARRLELVDGEQRSEALFFYSTGDAVFNQPLEYWLRATQRRWLRRFAGAEPVLVMVQPLEPGVSLEPAIRGLLPLLPKP